MTGTNEGILVSCREWKRNVYYRNYGRCVASCINKMAGTIDKFSVLSTGLNLD
jgi:hypothetical protein